MQRIVIFNQSSGYITTDIANALAKQYDSVSLVVGNDKVYERKLDESVEYRRIVRYNRSSSIKRLMTWICGYAQIFWLVNTKYRNYEVMYVTNPPMSCFASRFMHRAFDVLVFDVYPDALVSIGIKPSNILYRWWANKNKIVYAKARSVFTISDGMAKAVSKYVSKEKLKIIPMWPSSDNFRPIEKKDNEWAIEQNIQDRFVVLYSGNMGFTHNIDIMIEVAYRMKDEERILFLFIGQGGKKEKMMSRAAELSLPNCRFLDYQPTNVLPYSLASADVGVVTINNESAAVSVPSKTFNLMAVGAPLLCIAPEDSELSRLIKKYRNGKLFSDGDIDGIVKYLGRLSSDQFYKASLSNNSLVAVKDFSFHNAEQFLSK